MLEGEPQNNLPQRQRPELTSSGMEKELDMSSLMEGVNVKVHPVHELNNSVPQRAQLESCHYCSVRVNLYRNRTREANYDCFTLQLRKSTNQNTGYNTIDPFNRLMSLDKIIAL
jgi:hypothetical protein